MAFQDFRNVTCGAISSSKRRSKNFGFTLAEVLITLTIIGVIAALTIPNLIAKHDKQVTVTKLKKVYTTLSQAFKQIELNDPDFLDSIPSPYDRKVWYALDEKIRPYLKVSTKCNTYLGENLSAPECKKVQSIIYKQLNGNDSKSDGLTRTAAFIILDDGTIIMYGNQGWCGFATSITVDINGIKGPNTFGKDTFIFVYNTNTKYRREFVPSCNFSNSSRESFLSTSNNGSCTKSTRGDKCSALIMKDGWQIKDDYPW